MVHWLLLCLVSPRSVGIAQVSQQWRSGTTTAATVIGVRVATSRDEHYPLTSRATRHTRTTSSYSGGGGRYSTVNHWWEQWPLFPPPLSSLLPYLLSSLRLPSLLLSSLALSSPLFAYPLFSSLSLSFLRLHDLTLSSPPCLSLPLLPFIFSLLWQRHCRRQRQYR